MIFDKYLAVSQKRCKIGTLLLLKANRNSYAFYQMLRSVVGSGAVMCPSGVNPAGDVGDTTLSKIGLWGPVIHYVPQICFLI